MTLIARYKLDSDVLDTGPNGYHGSNNGVTFVSGQVNNSGDFESGNSNYIDIPALQSFSEFSFSCWIKMESDTGVDMHIIDLRNGNSRFRILYDTSVNLSRFFITNSIGTSVNDFGTNINDGEWHQIVVKWDGTNVEMFTDTVSHGSQSFTGSVDFSSFGNYGYLGRSIGSTFWDGRLDDVRIFDHALTVNEISDLYNYTGTPEIEINGIDYSTKIIDFEIGRRSIYATGSLNLELADQDNSVDQAIDRYQEVKVYFKGTLRFTGVIIDIDPGDNTSHILEIYAVNYWFILHRSPVNETYTTQTWSAILTDIIANNEYISSYSIGTANIDATVNTNSREYTGIAASSIAIEACMAEDYVAFIDENKEFIFKSNTKDDTGIHLVYADGDIKIENFKRTGGDIISIAIVRGKPGSPPNNPPILGIAEDDELISIYGKLPKEFNEPSLSTPQECLDWGEREIKRRNETPVRGMVSAKIDFTLEEGKLVTLTIPHKNITAQPFYIVSSKHSYRSQETEMDLVYYSRDSADYINEILKSTIKTSQYLTDGSAVATKAKKLTEPITVTSNIDVERRTYAGAVYGEFNYSEKYYGQMSGSWTSVIADQSMKITNKALEDFLRIFGQIATVPAILDSANAYIAVGSGITVVEYGDTTLENETFRLPMTVGHPLASDDGELELEIVLGDSIAITTTIANCGVFNAISSGNLESTTNLGTSISKAADEEIRFTIRIKLTPSLYLTTVGVNLLRDYIVGFELSDFLDNSNAAIEITTDGPSTYREGMEATHPKFINTTKDTMRWQINIEPADIVSEGLGGETFTEMDLYNKTSIGIKVIDGIVGATTFANNQELWGQILLKLTR